MIELVMTAKKRMSIPAVQQEAEEEWEADACVQSFGLNVKHTVPLER
jgi:hypothetical protein